jgi:hypothetical protein
MSADKHFHPPAPVPDALEDHQPDDMPAARGLVVVILSLLVVCSLVAALILGQNKKHSDSAAPANTEQVN